MGAFSTWLANITDPSEVQPEVMQALQALDIVIDELYQAEYHQFTYDAFFSDDVNTTSEALEELADAMVGDTQHLVTIPCRGEALVDATRIVSILVHHDSTLGVGQIWLEIAPVGGVCTIFLMKNGSTMYTIEFPDGDQGPQELDLSFITVVKGDILTLYCSVANGAAGLAATLEI